MRAAPPAQTIPRAHSGDSLDGEVMDLELRFLWSPSTPPLARTITLERKLTLGRISGGVDVEIDDPRLSRRHLVVTRAGLIVEIADLGSRNGTYVNGQPIARRAVGPDDLVRAGDTFFEVGPPRPPATELADRVAPSELPILLLGETGTGKDHLARRVHERSGRRGRFVALNCAALPPELVEATLFGHRRGAFTGAVADSDGFFAQAEDGTLFLDEVGELPLAHQAKLLRVLETREYVPVGSARVAHTSARIVAATNADVRGGGFRGDLYARLAGAVIHLQPLRQRRAEIVPLAEGFLAGSPSDARFTLTSGAVEQLLGHPWPHNIRELRAAIARLVVFHPDGGELTRGDIAQVLDVPPPPAAGKSPAVVAPRATPTHDELAEQLRACRGNVQRLAATYGKDAKQIYRWLKKHGLDPAAYR